MKLIQQYICCLQKKRERNKWSLQLLQAKFNIFHDIVTQLNKNTRQFPEYRKADMKIPLIERLTAFCCQDQGSISIFVTAVKNNIGRINQNIRQERDYIMFKLKTEKKWNSVLPVGMTLYRETQKAFTRKGQNNLFQQSLRKQNLNKKFIVFSYAKAIKTGDKKNHSIIYFINNSMLFEKEKSRKQK